MQLNITEQDFDVICAGVGKFPIENAWPVFVKLQQQGQLHVAQKKAMEQAPATERPVPAMPKRKGGRPRKVQPAPTVNGSAGEPAQVTK